jgi:hypothetical protein
VDKKIAFDRLHAVARWLATEAPDREPVKTAIAILGILQGGEDRDLLLTLGRHEEFTLYAAVALQNTEGNAVPLLWELGKEVTGWGRIQIIERLAGTEDERIKAWLLREGYRNDIMNEYTALVCAETGDLLKALRTGEPDARLLKGAGAILVALIQGRGGPVEGIEAYRDGAEAAELYLRHLNTRDLDLEDFVAVTVIERFLREEEDEGNDLPLGWQQRCADLLEQASAIRSRPGWEEKVREKLKSNDRRSSGLQRRQPEP